MQRPGVCASEERVIALTVDSQPSGNLGRAGACQPSRSADSPSVAGITRSPLSTRFTSVAALVVTFCGEAATDSTCRPATKARMGRARPTPKRYARCARMRSLHVYDAAGGQMVQSGGRFFREAAPRWSGGLRPGLKNDLTRAGPRLSNHSEIRASGRGACNDDTQSDRLGRAFLDPGAADAAARP